jgi:hypothetical protein
MSDSPVNSPNVDEILLNLKIIGCIKKQDRLTRNDTDVLEIEINDMFQGVRRWWHGRSRNETIGTIRRVIQASFQITDSTLDHERNQIKPSGGFYENTSSNVYFNEENSNLLQRFVKEMNGAATGLDNLKFTYLDDTRISSEIEILKEQLELRIKKINSLLKIDIHTLPVDSDSSQDSVQ